MSDAIGEFELAIMLTVVRLAPTAYGAEIRRDLYATTGREYVVGAVYATLQRLEDKAWLTSEMSEPTPVRGGRARRQYRLTAAGAAALRRAEVVRARLWKGVTPRLKPV